MRIPILLGSAALAASASAEPDYNANPVQYHTPFSPPRQRLRPQGRIGGIGFDGDAVYEVKS